MDNARRLYVFHQADDARAFNPPDEAGRPDFAFLPFAIIRDGDPEPPRQQIRAVYPTYPIEFARILLSIDYLVSEGGIDVLNLSLGPADGGFDPDEPIQIATRLVHEHGIPVVVAAGNSGPNEGTAQPLALAPWTISVGATDIFGENLLDSSSRGTPNQLIPTLVSDGYSHLVIVDGPNFGPGTSFSCGKVSNLALWVKKCLELITGNTLDHIEGSWTEYSRPIRLPILGLADTGYDLRAADPLPIEVQTLLNNGQDSIQLERNETERDWYKRALSEFERYGLEVKPVVNPDKVKHALQIMAKPMPQYKPHEVGAGFLTDKEVFKALSLLTPSKFAILFCPGITYAHLLTISETLDRELEPLWDQKMVDTSSTYFYYGNRLSVAKVM